MKKIYYLFIILILISAVVFTLIKKFTHKEIVEPTTTTTISTTTSTTVSITTITTLTTTTSTTITSTSTTQGSGGGGSGGGGETTTTTTSSTTTTTLLYEFVPEPGTPYNFSGIKVQYNYFHIDPSTSRPEWGWNEQSWWDVIFDRLHPSVFVYDIVGDWYEWGNGTKNINKYNMLKSWSRKLAEYTQRDNVTFILIIGNARDTNIGIEGIIDDASDISDYISPYPVEWLGLDVEWTKPTTTEDVASSLSSLNATVSSKGSRFLMLYSVTTDWSKPFKNVYPVLAGTNCPAQQGCTRTDESPFGLWEITLLDNYVKGFGTKVGLYRPNMSDDWNDTIVVKAFDWADQTNNIGILSPNLDVGLLNKDEFVNAWNREAQARGYIQSMV